MRFSVQLRPRMTTWPASIDSQLLTAWYLRSPAPPTQPVTAWRPLETPMGVDSGRLIHRYCGPTSRLPVDKLTEKARPGLL